ncbi:nucleoside kinase [Garciella nitratireducens]|uniref:nucleoside kinase n=1 Tax=Garciella nitratireducens TaxID=218205 RepID=UPI001BD3C68F|nr:nucleoside kinase [Garciella nitratireducens]
MHQSKQILITFEDGTKEECPIGISLLELSLRKQSQYETPIVAAKVNQELEELNYKIEKNAHIEWLDLFTLDGLRIYQRSLVFVLIKAAKDLFPKRQLYVEHSLGEGIYCELHGESPLNKEEVYQIKKRMKEIIQLNLPINKKRISKKKAEEIFKFNEEYKKINLLKYRQEEYVNMYTLDGYSNYFFGYMVPNTGYLKEFDLKFYLPGMVLLKPTIDSPIKFANFIEQRKLFSVFRRSEQWARILGVSDIASLNKSIEEGKIAELMRVAEAEHEKRISEIADEIYKNKDHSRIILIAGPSSSGKTTFSKRLSTHLRVNGLNPVAISLDDYFVDRELTPRDENGEYDFENIEAIDLELFNHHLIKLIQGKEVSVPTYNFITGKREYRGNILKISESNPIIIEGIHGLNDKLTADIPKENKYKIYISALTQLNIDQHNRIPTTDTRLIRRMVRDSKFRSHDAISTLKLWSKVRRGEEQYIFPYQEEADIMFNSALFYELGVLKKYVEPLLKSIPKDNEYYSEAKRLLKFLNYFIPIKEESSILQNSILREFIGGNVYYL